MNSDDERDAVRPTMQEDDVENTQSSSERSAGEVQVEGQALQGDFCAPPRPYSLFFFLEKCAAI